MKCSICGSTVDTAKVAYIKGSTVICSDCFPTYYVRNCPLTPRRVRGESPLNCRYCSYKAQCDSYVKSLISNSKGS
ncbi:MAG: hypothetical protein RXO22_06800 [Thermocladium sp.]|nr:MAG: hypothetical protein AT710_05625 [Thermocladium sp. ECH_B]